MTRPVPADAGRVRHLRLVGADDTKAAHERVFATAHEQALALLATRARTRSELATALGRRGVPPEIVEDICERLTAVGLLDDVAYARTYAERESGRKAPRAVADALRRRGVPAGLARAAALAAQPSDVRATALSLARAALPRWEGLPPPVVARRLSGLLLRRGYDGALVSSVVREVLPAGSVGQVPTDV